MVGKKAQQATEAALTGLDRVAKTIESNHKAWGLNPKLASALVHQLDQIADSLEQGMFGEESLLLRQASLLGKTAKTFSSQDALDAYLKEHPGADKSKHKVDSDDEDTKKLKKDLKHFQGIQKGQDKSEKAKAKRKDDKDKKDDKAHFEKLKKETEAWRDAK